MKRVLAGAALLALCAVGRAEAGSPAVRSIDFVALGSAAVYSEAARRIAFHRFDPGVIGAPDLSGSNDRTGTFQLWTADADGGRELCLSCRDIPGGPRKNQHKGAPTWHRSGEWLVVAVEMPQHAAPHAKCHAGTGAYVDLWAVSSDGQRWAQLTRYARRALGARFPHRPVGALIPRLSRRGGRLVWAEMIGYDEQHPFGIWRLAQADFVLGGQGPRLARKTASTPGRLGTTFYEAWSFSPDDSRITLASDSGAIHPGFMDVQLWDPKADRLVNLTRSDDEYEEQAQLSPDGSWIVFMSTRGQSPRYDPSGDFWGTFRTDVWRMREDGTGAERLTYFNDPGHREYLPGAVNRAIPSGWGPEGSFYLNVDQNRGVVQTHETARIYRVFFRD